MSKNCSIIIYLCAVYLGLRSAGLYSTHSRERDSSVTPVKLCRVQRPNTFSITYQEYQYINYSLYNLNMVL